MSLLVTLWHLAPDRLESATSELAALHPVEEETLRELFARREVPFEPFWAQGDADWATDLLVRDADETRAILREALTALAGVKSWAFEGGIAPIVHAVVGADPERLHGLYRLSGGPPLHRGPAGGVTSSELAALVDAQVDPGFDFLLPDRFAALPEEGGLQGAWSNDALADLVALVHDLDSRAALDTPLERRERSPWKRLTGDARRAAAIREDLDAFGWAGWLKIAEAFRSVHAANAFLGYDLG